VPIFAQTFRLRGSVAAIQVLASNGHLGFLHKELVGGHVSCEERHVGETNGTDTGMVVDKSGDAELVLSSGLNGAIRSRIMVRMTSAMKM
jgi:ribosome-interacting GTPase 1